MKNLFSINKDSDKFDGDEFVVRRIDGDLKRRQAELSAEVDQFKKIATIPTWLLIAMYIIGGFGLICVTQFLTAPLGEDGVSYAQAYANAAWVIWTGPPCLLAALVILIIAKVREKKAVSSPAFSYVTERVEKFTADARASLGIPEDAPECDVFLERYKLSSRGKRKPAILGVSYITGSWQIFRDGDDLCFGDNDAVFRIPRERLGRFVRVNKRIMTYGWNKSTPCTKGEYKQYKLRPNNNGAIWMKPYLSLQITGSEEYEILFPPYEHEVLERLLGRYPE